MSPEAKNIPSDVSEISAQTLAVFLQRQDPYLQFDEKPRYGMIFNRLRALPVVKQQELLTTFFTGVKDFPNGAKFAKMLTDINNISWGRPNKTPDAVLLQGLIDQHFLRLCLPTFPARIILYDYDTFFNAVPKDTSIDLVWDTARSVATKTTQRTAVNARRETALMVAIETAWDAALDSGALWEGATDAQQGAEWVIVEDLMLQHGYNNGNPFEPLMAIYKLGLFPIGIVNKKFLIFVPPIHE